MILNATKQDLSSVKPAALTEYFGPWAIHADRFEALVGRFSNFDLKAHLSNQSDFKMIDVEGDGRTGAPYYVSTEGVAIIDVCGPMMKYRASMSDNCSTVYVRRQLSHALDSPSVKGILLVFDTPGGTVSGTQELAAAISKASDRKPVSAFVEDFCASAGYWAASQCPRIYANQPTAMIGSIGTYTSLVDYSEAAGKAGIKVHVIRAGDFKGDTIPGAPISEETIADVQRLINNLNDQFIAGVAQGRGVSEDTVRQWADGRVHTAKAAEELGLIEGLKSVEDVLSELSLLAEDYPPMKIENKKRPAPSSTPVITESPKVEETPTGETPTEETPIEETPTEEPETPTEETPTEETPTEETPTEEPEAPAATTREELGRFMSAFGPANGATWYQEGLSFESASAKHIETLNATIERQKKELASARSGEETPVSTSDDAPRSRGGGGLKGRIRFAAGVNGSTK